MQLRRLAALERQKIIDELRRARARDRRLQGHPRHRGAAAADRRRGARRDRRQVRRRAAHPDHRRTTATCRWRTSSPRRTSSSRSPAAATPSAPDVDLYRAQRRGGKGVRGRRSCAATTSSSTSSSPRPTTGCCSSPTRAGSTGPRPTSCPRPAATPRASTWPTCWPSSPTSRSPRCWTCATTSSRRYLVLATRDGLVKKTRLREYDSNRTGGVIAINLRDGDELISARLVARADDLLLVSRKGLSARFTRRRRHAAPDGPGHLRRHRACSSATATSCSPWTSCGRVAYLVTVTDGGYAKRTAGRRSGTPRAAAASACTAMKLVEERGSLVGALVCERGRRDVRDRQQRRGHPHPGRPRSGRPAGTPWA